MSDYLDWDSPIEDDGSESKLIEPGRYPFKITNLDKTISTGAKTAGAPMAVITVRVEHEDGEYIDIKEKIVLVKTLEWKLCQLFTAIGQRAKGEKLQPRWNAVIGSRGHCDVIIEDYKKKDGTDGKAVKIARYVDPAENKPTDGAEPWES